MKVIFLKDVARVAQRDTVKEISDGYALNFLIPRGLAEQATPAKLATWEERMKKSTKESAERDAYWAEALARLKGAKIVVAAKGNDKGHLYHQLSPDLITDAIKKEYNIEVPKESLIIKKPIREFGEHGAEIRVGTRSAAITVVVKGD